MNLPMFASFNPSLSTQQTPPFKLHIAVDFGTDGTGLAYAYNGEVFVHSRWSSKKYGDTVKPKTIILLDNKGNTLGFGADATFNYISMPFHKDNWMLFERFKMSLYENELNSTHNDDQKINISNVLTAVNGKICGSDIVFISAFKHIQKEAKKFLKKKKIKNIRDNEIQWILTVPAIWNDKAKDKMKQWIIKAGLVSKYTRNQCKIVYEPDCASLSIQYRLYKMRYNKLNKIKTKHKINKLNRNTNSNINNCDAINVDDDINENKLQFNADTIYSNFIDRKNNKKGNNTQDEMKNVSFNSGDKYILCDAGGGTVDIACHEILNDFGVKEILHPSGGPWGSCYIDDQYSKLLESIFSKEWMDEFINEQPNIFQEIKHNFQSAKSTFYQNPSKTQHNIRLPTDFLSFLEEKIENLDNDNIDEIEDIVGNVQIDGLLAFDEEYLEIGTEVWKSLFDYVVNPIINHIKLLLNEPKLMRNVKYCCLVGGLSCSPYFQYKIRKTFGLKSKYSLKIIIPKRPILSVVEGAAYFGLTHNYIKARILRKTYGIKASFKLAKAKIEGISQNIINKNKIFLKYYNGFYIKNCFKVLGRKNTEMHTNQIIKYLCKRQPGCNVAKIEIICSDMEYPKMAKDGFVAAKLKLIFNKNFTDMDKYKNIQTEFHFYDTTLKVLAYCQSAKHIKAQVQITYVQNANN